MAKTEVAQSFPEEELLRENTIQTIIKTTKEILREHGTEVKKPAFMDRVALIIASGPIGKSDILHGQIAQNHDVVLRSYGRRTSKAFAITMNNIEGSFQTNPDQETDTSLIINDADRMPTVNLWNRMNDERKVLKEASSEALERISHRLITAQRNFAIEEKKSS